jgi:hypothetical protein
MRDSPQQHPGGLRRIDDTFDDNRDDNGLHNYVAYTAKPQLKRLNTAPARSWQCGGQGFESP